MVRRGLFILLANILICAFLILSYALNIGLGQTISMVIAGFVTGSLFTMVAWLINHSQMEYFEKRNLVISLYVILSVVIFWLAAVFGDGSILNLHKVEDLDAFSLVLTGGIFGLMMGFGLSFDYALLNRTKLSRLSMLVSFLGFSLVLIWYLPSDGLLFVVSVIVTRIILSIFINRVFAEQTKNRAMTLGTFVVSLTLIVLPLAAYLSK